MNVGFCGLVGSRNKLVLGEPGAGEKNNFKKIVKY